MSAAPAIRAPTIRGEDAVRTALIEAAADLLARQAPSAISARDVARRAGVNHGQVHHYFGSKRKLLEATMRHLAERHAARADARSDRRGVPPVFFLGEDPSYWRAVCQVVLDGDLDLARIEVDEGVSVPRRALERLLAGRRGDAALDFKARFAAVAALQLGWVAFEDFLALVADVPASQRRALRDRVRERVLELMEEG